MLEPISFNQFQDEGFLVLHSHFSEAEKTELRKAWELLRNQIKSSNGSLKRSHRFVNGKLPDPIGSIYKSRKLVDIAKNILGNDVALYLNRLLVKDEDWNGDISVHQDMPYFHGTTNKLSVFVPLGLSNQDTGGLHFVVGSHKYGNLGVRGTIDLRAFPEMTSVVPSVDLGDILLMDMLTWHFSENAKIRSARPLLQIIYQGAHDGAYFSDGLDGPTLVSGEWKTKHFMKMGYSIIPHGESTRETTSQVSTMPAPASLDTMGEPMPAVVAESRNQVDSSVKSQGAATRVASPPARRKLPKKRIKKNDGMGTLVGRFGNLLSRVSHRVENAYKAINLKPHPSPNGDQLQRTMSFVRGKGAQRIGLCYYDHLPSDLRLQECANLEAIALIRVQSDGHVPSIPRADLPILTLAQAISDDSLDAIIVVDREQWAWILRLIEGVFQKDIFVLPASAAWVVNANVLSEDPQKSWQGYAPSEYAKRSSLTGHYVEFGTFWGRSFFQAYARFRGALEGKFYSFDSFQGLSKPQPKEVAFSGGDYREATYCYNLKSFMALTEMVQMNPERLMVVPGFYSETLKKEPSHYGLQPHSVSVCAIDCDLYEPTLQALEFVQPLLEPGALLYFDDWRLCRASSREGERAAALQWMKTHPNLELVELHKDHWQHQWFIYHM